MSGSALRRHKRQVAEAVDREITALGIEHDSSGNRAKAYLYCLETRCPQTGWSIPLSPSWVISKKGGVVARLVPNREALRFEIEVVSGVSSEEMNQANAGTVVGGEMVYQLDGETYRTPLKTIRGDYRLPDGTTGNRLRRWEKSDFVPREDDIFQERLYCIQWITKETVERSRTDTFFRSVMQEDVERERKVQELLGLKLADWQRDGLVPDMVIEPGDKTDEPIRTRGWAYWHQLFAPRALHQLAISKRNGKNASSSLEVARSCDRLAKLCRYNSNPQPTQGPKIEQVFSNQALNTLLNCGLYSYAGLDNYIGKVSVSPLPNLATSVACQPTSHVGTDSDIFVTDPPYADAIRYEEITEFFIAWLRKNPPEEFSNWLWDSRRSLAIKGSGEEFRREMIAAYQALSQHMPDNGLQIVMFTHQDAGVWADMAAIVWGAGLRVSAAWYIATETTSELKKGGYVQGTVLLVLRKRLESQSVYSDELVQEVRSEVAHQIETMVGLNQKGKEQGRSENLFEDFDLQMAGYAAALRVLTAYSRIDGQDRAAEAVRPKHGGGHDVVREIIDFAVQVANEHLVPEGVPPSLWERLSGPERFFLKMLDLEAAGLKKIDNYQNFAKAFRLGEYKPFMASLKPDNARLKTALEWKREGFENEFGKTPLRAVSFALFELQKEVDIDEVMQHLRDMTPGYLSRREDLMAIANAIASRRATLFPEEAQAARILSTRIKNERLG